MYQIWTKNGMRRNRIELIALLLVYALATITRTHAGIVKRDISQVAVVNAAANATAEKPSTTTASRHENGLPVHDVDAGLDAKHLPIINKSGAAHTPNGTNTSESNENIENVIIREENSRERDDIAINRNSTENSRHHSSLYENEEVAGNYDDVDESLGTKHGSHEDKKSPQKINTTTSENSVEYHNLSSIQSQNSTTTAVPSSTVSKLTEVVLDVSTTPSTVTTVSSIPIPNLPEKSKADQDKEFEVYKQQRNENAHLRNITSDHDVAINDIKDDNPNVKNITIILPSSASHQPDHPQPSNGTHSASASNVEGVTEKRAKFLVDLGAEPSNATNSNGLEWPLGSLKGVGEVSGNNVTAGRSNDTEDALKSLADLNIEGRTTLTTASGESSTSSDGLLNESLWHNNSSRIDDSVHQDNSITSFQITTVTPKPSRAASITRKELEARKISDDVSVFNSATGGRNDTKESLVQANTDLNQSARNEDKVPLHSDAVPVKNATTHEGSSKSPAIEIATTALPSSDNTEVTSNPPVTTTEMEDGTTTETPDLTTIIDELITTNTHESPRETTVSSRTVFKESRTIPKRTTNPVESTSTTIPDVEITTYYSTTIANKISEVDEPGTTILPETTTHSATSRSTHPDSTTEIMLTHGPTSHSTASIQPTEAVVETSTSRTASPRPTISDKMNIEISTTAIDLNRQEDKYSTIVDPVRKMESSTRKKLDDSVNPESTTSANVSVNEDSEPEMPLSTSQAPIAAAGNPVSDGLDVNAIIAISVSVVGVIALILLVAFLFIMRKRQKQLTYGQRCRPVGLDAYSLDNISVYNSVRRKGALRSSKRAYGNAAFDDPGLKNNLLNISALSAFVQKKTAIYDEFKDVPLVTARIDEVPAGCEDKNRYANIVPLPESRVHLKRIGDDEKTEYINANFVKGPKDTTHYYIACQAPMENTLVDFWRMIWEQNSRVIIMATDLTENGIEKCADYLPPSFVVDNHAVFGDYQIILKNREVKEKYAVSSIHLKNAVTKTWREITHLWYQWPEKGTPTDEASIIAMLLEARSYLKMNLPEQSVGDIGESSDADLGNGLPDKHKSLQRVQGPLTVHCSPGTGRTGTIIACDIAIRALEQPTRSVDVPQIVYVVRRGRASAVQTREQYEFIYKIAHMYATKLTGPISEN